MYFQKDQFQKQNCSFINLYSDTLELNANNIKTYKEKSAYK